MWMWVVAAVLALAVAVVLIRRRRMRPRASFLDGIDFVRLFNGPDNPEATPVPVSRPCGDCDNCANVPTESLDPPAQPSPEGLAMAREWAERLNARNKSAHPGIITVWELNGSAPHSSPSSQELTAAQDWTRQSVLCAHCGHAARYHANKGLDPKGKCDPWYTGDRCDCPGFEPVTSRQSSPS